MFCKECDAVLIPKKSDKKKNNKEPLIIGCPDCDFRLEEEDVQKDFVITEKIEHDIDAWIEIVDPEEEIGITPEIREELREQFREALRESSE